MDIDKLLKEAKDEIESAKDQVQLEQLKIHYAGRKGLLSQFTKSLSELPVEKKKILGQQINQVKTQLQELLEKQGKKLAGKNQEISEKKEGIADLTLPSIPARYTHPHPLSQLMDEIVEVFNSLGYSTVLGPEIESDYFNFTALNIPEFHPARDMQDTFYIKDTTLLRTHTSPVQIHIMQKHKPPIRVIAPGKVYRYEAVDATHSFMFHQVEGLAIDTNITFADLKATLALFVKRLFGKNFSVKFKPSYFPFTEPSAELLMQCIKCAGAGCSVCKQSGWIEMLGCGMVHPKVFDNTGYDRNKYRGFAFGMGVERLAMIRYGIEDIRTFFENDIRFLEQL